MTGSGTTEWSPDFGVQRTKVLKMQKLLIEAIKSKGFSSIGGCWILFVIACVCPRGIRDLLLYFEKEYTIPSIYITESGRG